MTATRPNALVFVAFHGVPGERDDGAIVAALAENPGGRVAIHDGHLHIHEDEIEFGLGRVIDGDLAIGGFNDGEAGAGQDQPDQLAIGFAIINEEDGGWANRGQAIQRERPSHGRFGGLFEAGLVDPASSRNGGTGDPRGEHAPFPDRTGDANVSPHGLSEPAADG